MELFILPDLARHTTTVNIESKKFLFFRNLKAELELENGIITLILQRFTAYFLPFTATLEQSAGRSRPSPRSDARWNGPMSSLPRKTAARVCI